MNKRTRLIISLSLNFLIGFLVILASIMSLANLWPVKSLTLEGDGIRNIKYYTWQSNLFAGATSLVLFVYQLLVLLNKKGKVPFTIFVFKFVGVVGLLVTFITVLFIFVPIMIINNNFVNMYSNSNFFFHLVVPLLGLISFIFFDDQPKYKFRFSLLTTISMNIYGLYYFINVLVHLKEDLTVDREYDWYGYASNGVAFYPVSYIVTFGICLGSALLLNFLSQLVQRKIYKDEN